MVVEWQLKFLVKSVDL